MVAKPESLIKINAEDATKYIGKKVMVCSQVYGVKELSNINFINLGAPYPDNSITVVILSSGKENFKQGLQIYNGKKMCVTGTVKEYKGKPEIVISNLEEISIQ